MKNKISLSDKINYNHLKNRIKMKTKNIMMAIVAVFISVSVMTAAVPAKKTVKSEPVKKECCDQAKKAECKDKAATECKDKAATECKDKAATECKDKVAGECKDKATTECKDKTNLTAQDKSACCESKKKL